jgi:murein DD-endopeptidase MepM/ murein hydrolase activator NlpD
MEGGFGPTGGAAVLTIDRSLTTAPVKIGPVKIGPVDLSPARKALSNFKHRLEELDLVVDLGARIGSREWFRGAATCFALCASAWSLGPSLDALPGSPATPMAPAQWDEARALTIAPLAFGADTGRRMGATDTVEFLAETPDRPRIELTATLGSGDGFVRALQRAGVGQNDAKTAADLVSKAVALGEIEPGTRMDLVLGRRATKKDPRPLDSLNFRAKLELALAVERPEGGGALGLRRIPIAVDDTPLRIKGVVGDSLYRAARAAGAPAEAVQSYLRALGGFLSINRDVAADDKFDLVVAQRRAETGEVEIGNLLYAGLEKSKKKIQLMKWTIQGRTDWFEASGVGERRGSFQRPVIGRQTSSFGLRLHPLLGYTRFHRGVDYGAPSGTPIVAVSDGRVTFAGRHGGHGNYIKLSHASGLETAYAHLSRFAVSSGTYVRQGQVIGYVGSTGLSTGPHLHFEVYKNGAPVNPTGVQFITQPMLAGAELQKFRGQLANYLTVKPGAEPYFAKRQATKPEKAQAETAVSADTKSAPKNG